uniref:Putative terminase n=1 Tax=viral metagenome TaxID=1070528 RepID=A0A6M3K523_9ZZZZ
MYKHELTEKENLFCLAYAGEAKFNAVKSAEIAGYGGSYESLGVIGHENLKKLKIKERIKELTEQRLKDAGYQVDRIIKELVDIAFADIKDYVRYDANDNIKVKFDPEQQATCAISEINTFKLINKSNKDVDAYVTKIKLHDKKWALEMLSKLLDMKSGDTNLYINHIDSKLAKEKVLKALQTDDKESE